MLPDQIEPLERLGHHGALSELEVDTIDIFVRFAHMFGVSNSIGEIYGLLFVAPGPVPFDYVREKLKMSNGSASQGLRLLRTLGAVKLAYVAGDRRDHYVAETGLRKLVAGFLRERIAPNFSGHEERLARLSELLEQMPKHEGTILQQRIKTLHDWRQQAKAVLPRVMQSLKNE